MRKKSTDEPCFDPDRYLKLWQTKAKQEFWNDVKTFLVMCLLGAVAWSIFISVAYRILM